MSARNVDSLDRRLTEILNDLLGRVRRLERRRPTGTGGGTGVCDCEDGAEGPPGPPGADSVVPGPKGDTGDTGPAGTGSPGADGADGADGAPGYGLRYLFSTSTSVADPGDGFVRYDGVAAGLATKIIISGTDDPGQFQDIVLPTWAESDSAVRGTLKLIRIAAPDSQWAEFQITGFTSHSSWFEFAVTPVQDAGALPPNNDPVFVVFSRTGDKGATGATGATGAAGTTATSIVASAVRTSSGATGVSSVTDITGASVTFTAVAGRQYEITALALAEKSSGSPTRWGLRLIRGSTTIAEFDNAITPAAAMGATIVAIDTPGAGSVTYKLALLPDAGVINHFANATTPTYIIVKDLTGGATTGEVTTASPLGAPGTPNLLRSYKGVMFMDTGNYWWPLGGAMEQIAYEWTHFFNNNAQKIELQSSASGGAANAGTSSAGNQGVLSLSTSTSSTGRAGYAAGQSSALRGTADKLLHFHTRVRFPTLSTGTERYYFTAGYLSSMTGVPGDGFYFRYDDSVSANWYCVVVNNATGTAGVSSGVAVATNSFQKLRVEVDEPNASAKFYIDNSLVQTITTNFPGSTRDFGPAINMRKTIGTTDRTCDVDYVGWWSLMTTTV